MSDYTFRRALKNDLDLISKIRIEVLAAANKLENNTDMKNVFDETRDYYSKYLGGDKHITVLAFNKGEVAGCGSICFYRVMPTYNNQTGKKAYIMNMYTKEKHRRKGIASEILKLLVKAAEEKRIEDIQLEATEMGKALYKKHGFVELASEMELRKRN